ncbi:NAD(P)-binding protein [Rhizodiscina lignyota]|uniref:NAD(P)-binding protein n=1 Tax=Rhizodiscina lignyota TaxID=1504668 RepID=A0A9P4M7D5_9PEZI|nr:NAD(P)-binding protein [Rhizodiscina lignyota]
MVTKPLTIGVLGPTGFGGSYLCVELLQRGHHVVGISRSPEKLGKHDNYSSKSVDLNATPVEDLVGVFHGLDVLINEYGPHTAGVEALQYKPFLELTRKIIIATKAAKVGHFIMIGGTGSLEMPDRPLRTASEDMRFWLAYRRAIADSEAHTVYMEERLGSIGASLRAFRNARIAEREGRGTEQTRQLIRDYEDAVLNGDPASDFITGARTSFMFFNGNTSFRWSFVSPSARYRPGKRTGTYEVIVDTLPLEPKKAGAARGEYEEFNDRLQGISVADLAIAISDEAEEQTKVGVHWTAVADMSDDQPRPSYITL